VWRTPLFIFLRMISPAGAAGGGGHPRAGGLWRFIANALGVNDDFLPAVSVGDGGCLIAGGLPPAVMSMMNRGLPHQAVPAIAGALAAFVINVVIL
jgi:hypothetical protein